MSRPAPDLRRERRGAGRARRLLLLLGGSLIAALLVLAILAARLSGAARLVALALLAGLLLLAALALWQAGQAMARANARRDALVAAMREARAVGLLLLPPLPAEWAERFNRSIVLAAGPHLWVATPENAATPGGQRALAAYRDLAGIPREEGQRLELPGRATLALFTPGGDLELWDLSTLVERDERGDETAREELLELELLVQELAGTMARGG